MKLSAYHKAKGHKVEWWSAKGRYDLVYKSRVFTDTYSKDTITVTNAEQVILGGTGYGADNRLPPEVEHSYPDYAIYPQFFGIAYGFLKMCIRDRGTVLIECGKLLQRAGYRIKVLNTINFKKSMHYNPLSLIHIWKSSREIIAS